MRDKLLDIENSMLNPIHREYVDLQPFSKMNYFKRGVCMKNRYPKTRKKNRADPNTRKCPGATFRNKERVFKELRGEG